ncbi:MAG TPA: zinc-ribbon domain-containing protein, partial [Candidatus Limnocylindrales bacterium]
MRGTTLVTCSNCGTENEAGQKFCDNCGASLAVTCAVCGTTNRPTARFCRECATALSPAPAGAEARDGAQGGTLSGAIAGASPIRIIGESEPAVERRLVSVLFADLVGFTPYSEARDAEEVRDTLDRYFEIARDAI